MITLSGLHSASTTIHLLHWQPKFEYFCISFENIKRCSDLDKVEATRITRFGLEDESLVAKILLEYLTTRYRTMVCRYLKDFVFKTDSNMISLFKHIALTKMHTIVCTFCTNAEMLLILQKFTSLSDLFINSQTTMYDHHWDLKIGSWLTSGHCLL